MIERLLAQTDAGLATSFGGLRPSAWICAGAGFSREDVKALLLSRGVAFTGDAVQSYASLCQRVVMGSGLGGTGELLQSPARQEVLRELLSVLCRRGLGGHSFHELKRLRRQRAFLRRLDTAIQTGRSAFAHWEEAAVYSERLGAHTTLRAEIEILAHAYESWLERTGSWDPPRLARKAVEILNSETHRKQLRLPEVVYHLSAQSPESLERSFWESLSRHVQVMNLDLRSSATVRSASAQLPRKSVRWERWHTIDDAAEAGCDELLELARKGGLPDSVILIPDLPLVRRSLKRSLEQCGILLSDARDPTRIRWDEGVKWGLLPLEVAARGFERPRVVALIRSFFRSVEVTEEIAREWVAEISDRGIRNGLKSYSGGKLAPLHQKLSFLSEKLGGKKTVRELAQAHLDFLERAIHSRGEAELRWVLGFFEQVWKGLSEDLERVELGARRAGALFWLERLQSRVQESPVPVERLKPYEGLDVYRLHQAPPRDFKKVFVLGFPPLWLSSEGASSGDYWFSAKEREILGAEFAVRSGRQVRLDRLAVLSAWIGQAEEVTFLDANYEPDGRERETILPALEELATLKILDGIPEAPSDQGAHLRWIKSYGALRPVPPQEIRLEPLGCASGKAYPVISATALENYSRCGFLALARQRWRLEDLAEPDTDLWPQVKGILLHEAVRVLIESRSAEGVFSKTVQEAIELVWNHSRSGRPRGLLRGPRIESYVKTKLATLLQVFLEQERKFAQRAGTRVIGLENVEFEVEYQFGGRRFAIVGEPDRIDEHPDGLWIMDYKTSSQSPNGSVMLENGYRLQLPFYSVAAERKFGKPVLGFQFVQLDRKGTRTNGVYFKSHNGKEPGKLTDTTARSKSLLSLPREEVWARFEEAIQQQGAQYVSGVFTAYPRIQPREKECSSCTVSDFCGFRRLLEDGDEESTP